MHNQQRNAFEPWIALTESAGNTGVSVSIKRVQRIDDPELLLILIDHRVRAARDQHQVFDAIAIEIAGHRLELGIERAGLAELLMDIVVIRQSGLCQKRRRENDK